MKILWASRHVMTAEQLTDLEAMVGESCEVVQENMTLSAHSTVAVKELFNEAVFHNCPMHIAAVLPAHVAAAVARQDGYWRDGLGELRITPSVYLPVSVPAPAVEGQSRGFIHSHWEIIK